MVSFCAFSYFCLFWFVSSHSVYIQFHSTRTVEFCILILSFEKHEILQKLRKSRPIPISIEEPLIQMIFFVSFTCSLFYSAALTSNVLHVLWLVQAVWIINPIIQCITFQWFLLNPFAISAQKLKSVIFNLKYVC